MTRGLPTGGQGSKVYVLCAEPKEYKHFRPGTRLGGFGYPAGRIGDRGEQEIVYVPNVYVPFPAPNGNSSPCRKRSPAKGVWLASAVTIYRMGDWSGAKIRGKWERKWKVAPGLKSLKNGHRNGKMTPKMGFWPFLSLFFLFGGHFSAISGWGPFSISFPIFPGFLRRTGFPFSRWSPRTQSLAKK